MKPLHQLVVAALSPLLFITPALGDQTRILYLYGDVADDGTVPSGEKEPFHQMRLHDEGDRGLSEFTAAITELGFEISEAYDRDFLLNETSLRDVKVLVLGSNQRRFEADEAAAVDAWVRAGGGLVAWSDSAFGGHWQKVGLDNELGRLSDNDLTVQFGMYFMTDNGAGNYLIKEFEAEHFLNADKRSNGIGFRGEGVSPVRVSPPAKMLARLQDGGLGGKLRLNKKDGEFDPARDAALAIASIDQGRVVGVFDRNLFWNAGEGTRLSHNDNREFTQRLMVWAAGREDQWADLVKTGGSAEQSGSHLEPLVEARYQAIAGRRAVKLIADITDEDNDGRSPEATWVLKGENQSATFANDNPNGAEIEVSFPQAGRYQFELQVRDGEHLVKRMLEVEVP